MLLKNNDGASANRADLDTSQVWQFTPCPRRSDVSAICKCLHFDPLTFFNSVSKIMRMYRVLEDKTVLSSRVLMACL
jgi:hypothetical protein